MESPATASAIAKDKETIGCYAMRLASDNETQSSRLGVLKGLKIHVRCTPHVYTCTCKEVYTFKDEKVSRDVKDATAFQNCSAGSSNICLIGFSLWRLRGMLWTRSTPGR